MPDPHYTSPVLLGSMAIPANAPAGLLYFYNEGGVFKVKDDAGNVIPLAAGGGGITAGEADTIVKSYGIYDPTVAFLNFATAALAYTHYNKAVKGVTTSPTNLSINVKTSTGYAKSLRWDGSFGAVSGAGTPGTEITVAFGSDMAAPYNGRIPKGFAVFPCASGGSIEGDITFFSAGMQDINALDVVGLSALTEIWMSNNNLTSLCLKGLSALTTLIVPNNYLKSLDVSEVTNLEVLYASFNNIDSIDVSNCTSLTDLDLGDNRLTALDVSGLTSLASLYCYNNFITSLDLSGLSALNRLSAYNCAITSIDATGVSLDHSSYGIYGSEINNNLMNGAALDAFYTSLSSTATGIINVSGNTGTATDTPTIATAKGYTITGT